MKNQKMFDEIVEDYKFCRNKLYQYFEEKSRFAYNLYKQGKFFRKARAIIKDGDYFLVLHVPEKDIYGISGGGINDGETATNGCKREVLEEMGIKVTEYDENYCLSIITEAAWNITEQSSTLNVLNFIICANL